MSQITYMCNDTSFMLIVLVNLEYEWQLFLVLIFKGRVSIAIFPKISGNLRVNI
jgi:hypothetical protein